MPGRCTDQAPPGERNRGEGADPVPEPGVDDAGDVAGSGQVPLADVDRSALGAPADGPAA